MVNKQKERERVQFDFSLDALERLDAIKEKTGATTRADVIRHALRVFEWLVNDVDAESTITVVNVHKEEIARFKAKLLL